MGSRWDTWEFEIQTNEDTGRPFRYDIAETYDKEYNILITKKHYFFGCPFSIYKSSYRTRLSNYLEKNKLDLYTELNLLNKTPLISLLSQLYNNPKTNKINS